MTNVRPLVGALAAIAVGLSFGLTVLFFGFVVVAGLLLIVAGLGLLALPGRRRTASEILVVAGAVLSGPLIYVGLAVLQPWL